MRRRSALAPLVAALVLAGSLASTAAPTDVEAAFPGGSERIAFVDLQPGESAVIWSMTADGADLLQLTTEAQSPYGDFDPAWSPGGKMLVFTRYTSSGRGEIWRMLADGSGQKRLTSHAADDVLPTFSADGETNGPWILFLWACGLRVGCGLGVGSPGPAVSLFGRRLKPGSRGPRSPCRS